MFEANQASPTVTATVEAVANDVDDGDLADVELTGTTTAQVRIVPALFDVLDDDLPEVSVAAPTAAAGGFLYEGEAGSSTDSNDDGSGAWTLTRVGILDEALAVTVEVAETGSGDFVADLVADIVVLYGQAVLLAFGIGVEDESSAILEAKTGEAAVLGL